LIGSKGQGLGLVCAVKGHRARLHNRSILLPRLGEGHIIGVTGASRGFSTH
jgi:hypothetical protein